MNEETVPEQDVVQAHIDADRAGQQQAQEPAPGTVVVFRDPYIIRPVPAWKAFLCLLGCVLMGIITMAVVLLFSPVWGTILITQRIESEVHQSTNSYRLLVSFREGLESFLDLVVFNPLSYFWDLVTRPAQDQFLSNR